MKALLLAATLIILALAAPAIAAKNPDGVAVIIGNKTYQGDIPAVDYAHNDADAIRRYVLDVLGYDPENVIDLRDASKAEMEAAFGNDKNPKGRLWQYLDPKGGSDVLVYYSGHGVPGQNDQRSYMLPANADPAYAEINGYALDVLYKNLGKLKARSKTVLIDACFSGASPKGMLIDAASPVFITAKASEIGEGMTVLTAASGDQLASWDKKAKHGLFTEHLLEALYGKGDVDGDGRVTAAEIKGYLDDKMTRAARRTYRRVQEATLLGEGGSVLASYTPGRPFKRTRVAGVEPVTPMPTPAMSDASIAWQSIQNSTNPDEIEQFILAFKGGPFAGIARTKLQALKQSQQATVTTPAPVARPKLQTPPTGGLYFPPGKVFKDCADCPEMVVIPAGGFKMGSNDGEDDERPVHRVDVAYSFAVGRYEITQAQWEAIMSNNPSGFKGDKHPVWNVLWDDAQSYIRKLSTLTGYSYRLLSEIEWEYVARAGTATKYSFGNRITKNQANFGNNIGKTTPVGSYPANEFGVYDMHGNVWEWIGGCYINTYNNLASDDVLQSGSNSCGPRSIRGGSWNDGPVFLRSASRNWINVIYRPGYYGFRIARSLQ